jgi:hypothetical protein
MEGRRPYQSLKDPFQGPPKVEGRGKTTLSTPWSGVEETGRLSGDMMLARQETRALAGAAHGGRLQGAGRSRIRRRLLVD